MFERVDGMSTVMEIEQAAVGLHPTEQKQLLRFLLRIVPVNDTELPKPQISSLDEIQCSLAEDQSKMRRLRERVS